MTDVPPHTIVVGTDGSATADRAVVWAAEQARAEGRDLTIVHAVPAVGTPSMVWMETAGIDSQQAMDAITAEAEQLLAEAARLALAAAPGLEIRGVVAEMDPRDALLDLAPDAAMLVLGSRGRGPVASLLLGSVAHALSRDARCPVVVVRPVEDAGSRRGVLVGVGREGGSNAALHFAYRQASLRDLPLRVVHCIWDARASSGAVGPGEEGYDAERLLLAQTVAGMAETYPDVEVETTLERGMVDRTLVRLGEDAELVVVGVKPRGRLAGLVRGRTSAVVTEQSTGIVAVVPEPAEGD